MRSETRASRLVYLRELFLGNPRGFTARELSDLTGVHIRTIQRDLTLLGTELGVALSQEGRRYRAINATTLG
ncbi:MAG TPA: HTH domain-containing protein, partial [Dehalococcoidia bacterium]